jgi:hypothetical protein
MPNDPRLEKFIVTNYPAENIEAAKTPKGLYSP